jgi:hypothetical protein
MLRDLNFQVAAINREMAELSSALKTWYTFLIGIDALQIAAALHTDCHEFL